MGIFEIPTKSGLRYQVKWRRGDGTQVARNFRTLTEAKEHKRRVEYEKDRGNLPDDRFAKVTFSDFAMNFVFPTLDHSETTLLRRDGIMKNHLLPTLGLKPVSQIRRNDILQLVQQWRQQGLSARSIRNHLNVLRPIFREAILQNIVIRSPMEGIQAPRPVEVRRHPLTPEQCKSLLESVNPAYTYAIHFVLATGVRWSEFANMKVKDFNAFNGTVEVTDSKTGAGVRVIHLEHDEVVRISRHLADTGRHNPEPDSPLFTSPEGARLRHSNFRKRVFIPACKKAGLENVTFHDLRRTHATMLIAEGHDPKVVQERMGHRSISTTLTHYARATEPAKKRAAGTKARYLNPVATNVDTKPTTIKG